MILGVALFAVMDVAIKWLTTDLSTTQVVAMRSWFGLPFLILLVHLDGGYKALRTQRPAAHFVRFLLVLIMSFTFFWALSKMKLVDAVAIHFAAPIFIAALSVPVLKEAVGAYRWSAILVGFVGVLIILRPGAGVFQWAAVSALVSTVVYALMMISTRALKTTESSAALIFYPQLGMSIIGLFMAPFSWQSPTLFEIGLFALVGALGSFGILCITNAFRFAPVASIGPFEYTALIWATFFGYLIWGELPDLVTIMGSSIVILSGLFILYRENLRRNAERRGSNIN